MNLVVSQFKIANGKEEDVRQAFLALPHLVDDAPGFLGMEVYTSAEDGSVFYLVTRWTDLASYRAWHQSDAHHHSNRVIPNGLKLTPGPNRVTHLERLGEPDLLTWTVDSAPTLAQFLADSRSLCMLVADSDGTIRLCNTALADRFKVAPAALVARPIWDLLIEQSGHLLRGRLTEGRTRSTEKFLLHLVDGDQYPFTLEFRLEVQPGYFLLLGEVSQRRNEAAQEEMLHLNNELAVLSREHARRGKELERALDELKNSHWHLKKIQEVLPICMKCGKIKTGRQWEEILGYLQENAKFLSHGYCPDCAEALKAEWTTPPLE